MNVGILEILLKAVNEIQEWIVLGDVSSTFLERLATLHQKIQQEKEDNKTKERTAVMELNELRIAGSRQHSQDLYDLEQWHSKFRAAQIENKNRKRVNAKIMDSKTKMVELDSCYWKAIAVLLARDHYAIIKRSKKNQTKIYLIRCANILKSISETFCDVDKMFVTFGLQDADLDSTARQFVRNLISSVGRIVSGIILEIELDISEINAASVRELSDSNRTLFEKINEMPYICEKRRELMELLNPIIIGTGAAIDNNENIY